MKAFEFNKIAGGVLGAVFLALGLKTAANLIFATDTPQSHIDVSAAHASAATATGTEAEPVDLASLLAGGDVTRGEKVAKKCAACHIFDNSGKNKTGPGLWNIVNRPIGAVEGFSFSSALTELANKGTVWDFEALNSFIESPKAYAKGTKMAFAGIKKPDQRGDLLVYLNSLSDTPAPLPSPTPANDEASSLQSPPQPQATEVAAATTEAAATTTETTAAATATENATAAQAATPAPQETATGAKLAARLANADVERGEKVAKKCKACHTFDSEGKNKTGPTLWNIVNKPLGQAPGFKYSKAFQQKATEGFLWNYEALDQYILKPKAYIKGTRMAFAGIKKDNQRADLLLYLRSLADEPAPLPSE